MDRETPRTPAGTPPAPARPIGHAQPAANPLRPVPEAALYPRRTPMSPAEAREFDATPVQRDGVEALSPAQRELAREVAARASALFVKGLLNRLDPGAFPVAGAADSPEMRAAAAAQRLDAAAVQRMAPRLRRIAAEPREFARAVHLAEEVDFRRAIVLRPLARVGQSSHPATEGPRVVGRVSGTEQPRYNRAGLVLRAIHCVRATSPSDSPDDLVFGCTLIDAVGKPVKIYSKAFGEFHTGERASFGELPLGQVDLNTVAGYPKSMYAVIQLVESDRSDQAVANTLGDAMTFAATLVATIYGGPVAGAIVGSAVQFVGDMIAGMIDDDLLRPMGVPLDMTSADPFNGFQSRDLCTPDITGHGARYRVGYRWKLSV